MHSILDRTVNLKKICGSKEKKKCFILQKKKKDQSQIIWKLHFAFRHKRGIKDKVLVRW